MKKVMAVAAVAAGFLVAAAPAQAGGSACQLEGVAAFETGLTTQAQAFRYSFAGDLLNCQSDIPGAPLTGKVSTGNTRVIGDSTYQEPLATGNGSCASSTTSGVSIIDWADGGVTVVDYSTTGATALVGLEGSVVDKVTLTKISGTGPDTVDIATTTPHPIGATSLGSLVFDADGSQCTTSTGVKEAKIHGVTGVGDYA